MPKPKHEMTFDEIAAQEALERQLQAMKVNEIAAFIDKNWKPVNYAARPYLDAMYSLESVKHTYMADSGVSVVLYFLSNAASWRGDIAKAVKKELNRRIK